MNTSPRLTRAALTFLLFGTVAALLPSQDTTALAENGCFTGPAGSSGQLAIAALSGTVQNSYTLVPAAIAYKIYFKPAANSPYTKLNAGETQTTFVRNLGQVAVNGTAYSITNPTSTAASSFTAAQAVSFVGGTTYYTGSMTATSTYSTLDSQGIQNAYTATATFSAP